MLRHNAASAMVKNEVPIETIAAILGHATPDTTDISFLKSTFEPSFNSFKADQDKKAELTSICIIILSIISPIIILT